MNGSKISHAIVLVIPILVRANAFSSTAYYDDCLTLLEFKWKVIYQLELNASLSLKMYFLDGSLLQNTTPNENVVWNVILVCNLLEAAD